MNLKSEVNITREESASCTGFPTNATRQVFLFMPVQMASSQLFSEFFVRRFGAEKVNPRKVSHSTKCTGYPCAQAAVHRGISGLSRVALPAHGQTRCFRSSLSSVRLYLAYLQITIPGKQGIYMYKL